MSRDCIVRQSARARLKGARELVTRTEGDIVVVASAREAADDFVRDIASQRPATFGMHRFSLAQLASRLTRMEAARRETTPAASLMVDALTARACFEAAEAGLQYFGPVAATPGFPKAVRRTLTELRLANVDAASAAAAPVVGRDVAALLGRYDDALAEHEIADLADLYAHATDLLRFSPPAIARATYVLLDLPLWSQAEADLIAAISGAAAGVIATVPFEDVDSERVFADLGFDVDAEEHDGVSTLDHVRSRLFSPDTLPVAQPDDSVQLFSAPGESREALEIAREVLIESTRGVRFDEIAVAVRHPSQYVPHVETAFRRAGIPYYLAAGARRPDAAGRAFLALLQCGAENYSARRFAEYLSLGQVPRTAPEGVPLRTPSDPMLRAALGLQDDPEDEDVPDDEPPLREPWKWEEFIVEAAVLGGAERWERRLLGLEREYGIRLEGAIADDPDGPRAAALRRDAVRVVELRTFAVPVIQKLEELSRAETWGAWLDLLEPLARVTLKKPDRVLRALADLRPMADVGPVRFVDVVTVLQSRLTTLERQQTLTRFGRVFVAPIEALRGRSFRIVFVPGVGERAFPARLREDPILLDGARTALGHGLEVQEQRSQRERLLLRLVVGAASERLVVSYSRMDLREARGRVSSFYALDIARVMRGVIPNYETLEREAAQVKGATMAWPAPDDPSLAIDALEHDLASMKPLLQHRDPRSVRGHANYLLELHLHLGRALRARNARWRAPWTDADGPWRPDAATLEVLAAHTLTARAYSASALERFAECPYRFYLSAIVKLTPREEPERIEAIDPRTRGTIVHAVYANVLRALHREALIPLTADRVPQAQDIADATLDATATFFRDLLAPAIDAIWRTDIEAIRTDLRIWLAELAASADAWTPMHAELGFGIPLRDDLDPASSATPVVFADGRGFQGSIDLVEVATNGARVRIRDYKTGANTTKANLMLGGGRVLQPLLYAEIAEVLLARPATEGQLWFATSRAGFAKRSVALSGYSRRMLDESLAVIDGAVREGMLAAAPFNEDACTFCDYRSVCGPYEVTRLKSKDANAIAQLLALRERP